VIVGRVGQVISPVETDPAKLVTESTLFAELVALKLVPPVVPK